MRVLIYSRAFLPQVGGLELNVANLAASFVKRGHEVVVITTTPGGRQDLPYLVRRHVSPLEFLRWMRWCDVFHQPNVSLRGIWPLLLVWRPWVVTHHSWYRRPDGRIAWQDRMKRALLRFASASVAVSDALADDVGEDAVVINNAYRDDLFGRRPGVARDEDLVFLGRLVSDKGIDILLAAMGMLESMQLRPRLTIVGEGPERGRLEAQAAALGISARVHFTGVLQGEELVQVLNRHRIMVVPSRYDEPFGIVALEGIACGCVVVGSAGGGLKDAIGRCGRTFPNGDAAALARVLRELLEDAGRLDECLGHAAEHLARHGTHVVMDRYMKVFESAAARRR